MRWSQFERNRMAQRLLYFSVDKPTGSVWDAFSNLARRHQTHHNSPPRAQWLTAPERSLLVTQLKGFQA